MLKRKSGLQKEVSKIFTGIKIPRKDAPETSTSPAAPRPAAPSPAQRVEPKPVPAVPHLFTILEPEQHTQPTPTATPKVYEPQVPVQDVYEPPAPSPAPVRQARPELPFKSHIKIPGLKIWEDLKRKLLTPKPGVSPVKQKVMVLMMPVLFVVFVVVLTRLLRAPNSPSGTAANNTASSAGAAFEGKINWELPAPYPENLRDAMVFGAKPKDKKEEENTDRPAVKGIVYSEDNPCAVVGDRIVSAGDVVQGATVVKINPDSVEFTKGDESWTQKIERETGNKTNGK
jgi:hypothetical protein